LNKKTSKLDVAMLKLINSSNMPSPLFTPLNYTYKKPATEVRVLNFNDIPTPNEKIKDRTLVHLGPLSIGGNHQHPRTEWFVGFGPELEIHWLDDEGQLHSQLMNPNGELVLCEVPPFLPHAIRNNSQHQFALLLEFADAPQSNVESVNII
jgi:hypothetical protein